LTASVLFFVSFDDLSHFALFVFISYLTCFEVTTSNNDAFGFVFFSISNFFNFSQIFGIYGTIDIHFVVLIIHAGKEYTSSYLRVCAFISGFFTLDKRLSTKISCHSFGING